MLKEVDAFFTGDSSSSSITLEFPANEIGELVRKNVSVFLTRGGEDDEEIVTKPQVDYDEFFADIWIGVVLTLLVLSCVCLMCSCLMYHKFQQWKRSVIRARNASSNLEAGFTETDLPSYTIASGLPSYQEALEQLKKVKELTKIPAKINISNKNDYNYNEDGTATTWGPHTPPTPIHQQNTLSVMNLFPIISLQEQQVQTVNKVTNT